MIPRIAYALPLSLLLAGAEIAAEDAVDIAAGLIGRPYVWGAEGPRSFDCSGLTQYVFKEIGIDLPRRAISQSRAGRAVGRLQRGDLVFFSTEPGGTLVTHVGVYEGGGVMIDASKRHGRVRRDALDDEYWVERFLFARRVDADGDAERDPLPKVQRRSGRRDAAIRVLEALGGILMRKGRR